MNYKKTLETLSEEALVAALKDVTEIIATESKYRRVYLWEPHWREHNRKLARKSGEIIFKIGTNLFSYHYHYEETSTECRFESKLKLNNENQTMYSIDKLYKYISERLNEIRL